MIGQLLGAFAILRHEAVDVEGFFDCDLVAVFEGLSILEIQPIKLQAEYFGRLLDPVDLFEVGGGAVGGFLEVFDFTPTLVLPRLIQLFEPNHPDHDGCK